MTRIDDAAKIIERFLPPLPGGLGEEQARKTARVLDQEGVLYPDLPEPNLSHDDPQWRDEYADLWDSGTVPDAWEIRETWVGSLGVFPGQNTVTVWDDTGEPYKPISPYVARKMAYALLAAADHAERNQEC